MGSAQKLELDRQTRAFWSPRPGADIGSIRRLRERRARRVPPPKSDASPAHGIVLLWETCHWPPSGGITLEGVPGSERDRFDSQPEGEHDACHSDTLNTDAAASQDPPEARLESLLAAERGDISRRLRVIEKDRPLRPAAKDPVSNRAVVEGEILLQALLRPHRVSARVEL